MAFFVKNYQELVNCEIGKLCYKDYRVEEGCQYLTLHREIIAMKDCGSTISLVEGGKCKHSGTEMDYAAYDWVITDYSHAKTI